MTLIVEIEKGGLFDDRTCGAHEVNTCGNSWTSTFRVVDLDAEPEPPPTTSRQLVE